MRWTHGLGTAGLVVALAACGGSEADAFAEGSAKDITAAAAEDMKNAESLRFAGTITTDGQEITIDLALNTGGDCEGSVGLQGGTAEIIQLGDESWFRPDEAFWRAFAGPQADQILEIVGDKWVVAPPGESDFSSFCDLDEFLENFDDDSEDEKLEKGEVEDVDGQEAIVIDAETEEGDKLTAWVATDDPHYVLKMQVDTGDEPGEITFSDFDEKLDIQPPSDDEVIDLSTATG